MTGKNKIILIPRLNNSGGVANYYSVIRPLFRNNAHFIYRGKDKQKIIIYRALNDYNKYLKQLFKSKNCDVVVINSSLGLGGIIRDGIYTLITPKRVKKIVFFRGWDPKTVAKIDNVGYIRQWFKRTFLKADHIIVLSNNFKNKLNDWGYHNPISVESTLVDDKLINGNCWENNYCCKYHLIKKKILYLGNLSKAKGVWQILKSFEYVQDDIDNRKIELYLAGDGNEREQLKKYSIDKSLNVKFPGYIRYKQKKTVYKNAHLYLFPSNHGEGMPNSVLEAMASGLPIITTRVGGIPDFFEDGKMGLFLDNRNPEHIAEKLRYLLDRPEMMKEMSEYNYNFAKKYFSASKVAIRLERIIDDVVEGKSMDTVWWDEEYWEKRNSEKTG